MKSSSPAFVVTILVLVVAVLCGAPATGEDAPRARGGNDGTGVSLSIVVRGVPPASAPLRWVLYASADALPGPFSRGRPFRDGVVDSTGDPSRIEVGRVPVGDYFAIVGLDTNRDGDIGRFSEPRGYSGYDGCLIPSWHDGVRTIDENSRSIPVFLHCNRGGDGGIGRGYVKPASVARWRVLAGR